MEQALVQTDGFHMIAKPSGPLCNLDCHYCFYTEKESLFAPKTRFKMSDEVLETYIEGYIRSQKEEEIPFVWQGGEPTLMGLDFYRKVVEYQNKYAGSKRIVNSLQTNGTLLTDEWFKFLKENRFLVGLSIDGPEHIHDFYRVDRGGQPTFKKVHRSLKKLQEYGVEYNVLACVTRESGHQATEIYQFFKDEGVKFIQFIPIIERLPDAKAMALGLRHAVPPSIEEDEIQQAVSAWTVGSKQYGEFLTEVFDEWVHHDVGDVHVMNFEHALTAWLELPATSCVFAETCGRAGIVEHNGDVYSCDHYMYPDFKLGNIEEDTFAAMMDSERQRAFGDAKRDTLPDYCKGCEVRFACNGECPKHRFLKTPDGDSGLNYLCAGYKHFFHHIHRYMKVMVQLIENDLPVSEIKNVIKGPLIVQR